MIADLHCHYAMHLLERAHPRLRDALSGGDGVGDRARAAVMWLANRVANFRKFSGGPRVDLDKLEQGGVRLVLSVLLAPLDEIDLGRPYAAAPERRYFADLVDQLQMVERDLADRDPGGTRHVIARRAEDLDAGDGRIAFVHCVEGGFHLGTTPDEVDAHVSELAALGVAYVTLAHLFFRQVAANAPALPFLSDRWYDRVFPQPDSPGLTDLGRAAVRAMLRERVLVDLSHMRADAVQEALDLLDELDPDRRFPVLASHAGIRFPGSRQRYQLAEDTVRRVAARGGVVGLILAQHQLNDGVRRTRTRTLAQTVDVICRHVDRIGEVAGPGHAGLGTDLDGFIKPTMAGIESAADLRRLREPLLERYQDAGLVDGVLHGNAHRVVTQALGGR